MQAEELIRKSQWWLEAQRTPDRHYAESEGVTLADHLPRVHRNLLLMLSPEVSGGYFAELRQALANDGFDLGSLLAILEPVTLLHDIGKLKEDKIAEGEHPLTHKAVKMRHPIVSLIAALEILPESLEHRNTILTMVEEHDTPLSWYMQFHRSGQIPHRKSWAQLDRRIEPREDCSGLVLLSIFKLADVDGHENVEDVRWFIEQANLNLLRVKGKWVPMPDQITIQYFGRESS
jgi:hypothetical protein